MAIKTRQFVSISGNPLISTVLGTFSFDTKTSTLSYFDEQKKRELTVDEIAFLFGDRIPDFRTGVFGGLLSFETDAEAYFEALPHHYNGSQTWVTAKAKIKRS